MGFVIVFIIHHSLRLLMNSKTGVAFSIVAIAAVVLTGTVMGTQYVSAWHHGHHGGHISAMTLTYRHHGAHVSAMASSTSGGGGTPSGGGGGGGGGGY